MHTLLRGIFYYYGIVQVNYCLIKHALGANGFVCCVRASVCRPYMKEDSCARASILSLSLSVSKTCCNQVIFEIIYTLAQPGHFREAFAWQFYALFDLRRRRTSSKNNYGHGMQIKWNICCFFTYTLEVTASSCGGLLIKRKCWE
jgi:hypothetical protein